MSADSPLGGHRQAPVIKVDPSTSASTGAIPDSKFPAGARGRVAKLKEKGPKSQRNSTSTLYIRSTVSKPNVSELLHCVSKGIAQKIGEGVGADPSVLPNIFDERAHPLNDDSINLEEVPSASDIFLFINTVFQGEELSIECGIMMLVYIDRMIESGRFKCHPSNWRRVVLCTLILATKVWEEQEVWNVDFLELFPKVTARDLGKLEVTLLDMLQYNVSLKASVYAQYYFDLRQHASESTVFPKQPLDKQQAEKLEERSKSVEEKALKDRSRPRASSFTHAGRTATPPRAVLS